MLWSWALPSEARPDCCFEHRVVIIPWSSYWRSSIFIFNFVFWHLSHLVIFDFSIISFLWIGTICFFISRTSSTLLRLLAPCSSFICHFCVKFPHFRAEISSCLSASLGGERQRVWNFRGVCHCRDVARGSDRMIRLCTSWALYLSPMLYPMVYLCQWKSDLSSISFTLVPHNTCTMVSYHGTSLSPT